MIQISGRPADLATINTTYPHGSFEHAMIEAMSKSHDNYDYDSLDELDFELKLRKATVKAALELDHSGMAFAVFRKSRCNDEYWHRTSDGGFELQNGVKPSDAINDIYRNGHKYATECATAIVILFYKALLDVFPAALFDKTFPEITLMNWRQLDPVLRTIGLVSPYDEYLPGDRMYFVNPAVDPETPEWQGENVIKMDEDKYYGHGIGIENKHTIISAINRFRVEGATESAYLKDGAGRLDYKNLYKIYKS
jgi:protein-glutamine gamma-glutamyltransferase